MSLVKRIAFYVFVVFALAGACWAYLHLKETKKPKLKAEDVLPDSTLCLFSSNNFSELYSKLHSQNLVWNEAINIAEFKNIHTSIHFFDSIITENEFLADFFKEKKIFLGIYRGSNELNPLIIFNLDDLAQEKEFYSELSKVVKNTGTEDMLEFKTQKKIWFAKIKQGVVAMCDKTYLINKTFSETTRRLKDNKEWNTLSKLHTDNDLLFVYANHPLLAEQAKKQIDLSNSILSGHSAASCEMRPDELSVNGFNLPDSSSLLNMLSAQKAQACDFLSVLPFGTTSFRALGFHDVSLLRKKIKIKTSSYWKSVNDSAMFNAEGEFYNNIGTKLIEATIRNRETSARALIVEVTDTAKTSELITYISDTVINYQGVKAGRLHSGNGSLITACFGNLFNVKAEVGIVYDKYFIVADSAMSKQLMSALQNNSSIMDNEAFMKYAKENLGLNFNYLYYCSPKKHPEKIRELFPFLKSYDLKYFEKFTDFSMSVANYKSLLQFRIDLKYQQNQENKEVPGLWTFQADTTILSRPNIFINHKSGENELAIADAGNKLYLLNATGSLQWKKELKETVLSKIYTVDAFRNNKYQLLFNTRNYLYLVDRNGKDVEGFPVKLPTPASNALTVFDYEGTRDYRLFIACEDKLIYNYGINGVKNEKFIPVKTEEPVKLPLYYMKVAGSDYLVTADVQGKIYLFSRRGEGRIDFKNKVTEGCRALYADAAGSLQNSRLIYVDDKNSLIESISLTDKKEIVKLSSDFEDANYVFDLVDDDKKMDVVVTDKSHLRAFDLSGNELFAYEANNPELKSAIYFYDADVAFFILNTSGQVQVLEVSSKKVIKKFQASGPPLVSDLFRDGKKYILVANGNELKCVILK